MEVGLVGLPNAGKTTLFNALTKTHALVADYLFTTIDQNVGIVTIPDPRFDQIVSLIKPERVTPATVKFVDIAGLIKGASHGEGLGNQFLGHIRNVDAIVHVVRCFKDEVPHVSEEIRPSVDIETVNLELILADLSTVEKRLAKLGHQAKSGNKKIVQQFQELKEVKEHLEHGFPARAWPSISNWSELNLLTAKPIIYVANVSEENLEESDNPLIEEVKNYAQQESSEAIIISAKVEAEITELPEDEAELFRKELGLEESGLSQLIKTSYKILGLISFFTVVGTECRAWAITTGTKAIEAAEKIHTDFAKGFVKAEVVHYQDLLADGSLAAAREKGHLHLEGKEYPVQDGDVITFKFAA